MSLAVDTPSGTERTWTAEQQLAIERREGDLLLAAGAGSGKTSVLVERFVRAVIEDGLGAGEILTITFTEKAAAEMGERIRARLRELGEDVAAAAAEGAVIATIHGFCARVLRAHALRAGLDPAFAVLDEHQAGELAGAAFERALEELAAREPGAVELIAAHGAGALRAGLGAVLGELRSRGVPARLPALAPAPALGPALAAMQAAARAAATELGALPAPGVRVLEALGKLERCQGMGAEAEIWPGDLDALCLPGGNGAALRTPVCEAYAAALAELRRVCEHRFAARDLVLLDALLRAFDAHYAREKRARSALDFEDLELLTRDLLRDAADVRERYRARFARIMVDELQDTNRVQLELIDQIADGNLFTVGDAQQSIYGFRHADVALFEALAAERRATGAFATLQTNFRSRPELLAVLNAAFADAMGEGFTPLVAGRPPAGPAPGARAPAEPRVELLVVDKGADYQLEGLATPWRLAEARALAARVGALLDAGVPARELVVLTRATTDLRTYERALERQGVATYLIGGRGYWGHPQVVDLVAYLRALANPRDEEALYTVLASPMVGASFDALVLVSAAARAEGRHPWAVLTAPGDVLAELPAPERAALARFVGWFAAERARAGRTAIEELIDRALSETGYDLAVLAQPGGRRRLANVRKLMRLAREHEAGHGAEMGGFLALVAERGREGADSRESEAPVEGEALDAVRLMTIHRSKGLEFDVVCVADLGRQRRWGNELLRLSEDGRIGLRLARPGAAKGTLALDYRALGDERAAADGAEERRLFYVAMTRARERLIVTGAAKLDTWPQGNDSAPIGWVAPALAPDFARWVEGGAGVSERGVAVSVLREAPPDPPGAPGAPGAASPGAAPAPPSPAPAPEPPSPAAAPEPHAAPPLSTLSYTALAEYERCGYRFLLERVLGLPGLPAPPPAGAPAGASGGLGAAERGVLAHALLEQLDFRRPLEPDAAAIARAASRSGVRAPGAEAAAELAGLLRGFATSELCARLARATSVRREQRFSFPLDEVLVTGALDVLARERTGMLVVDYKSDRLGATAPEQVVAEQYAGQQLIYALAVLRTGAVRVEVAHVFLEAPERPVLASFTAAERPALEARLAARAGGVLRHEFEVTPVPHRSICQGCPAEGGLCSWPVALTRRERPDQLF
jgi:ATP-dependent helicase/nuclease subunit A